MPKPLTNIIFTRNRPLQLMGYLESFLRHMGPVVERVHILYKQELFTPEYEQVFKAFPQCHVITEKDFHDDFLQVLAGIETPYVMFATDDVVYFDSVDFAVVERTFAEHRDVFGFTLKFGPEYFADGRNPISPQMIGGQQVHRVNWTTATDVAAKYPWELNSTVYTTSFVREFLRPFSRDKPLLKRIFAPGSLALKLAGLVVSRKRVLYAVNTFHDPNYLEGLGYRRCRSHKSRLPPYLYFQRICATTLQINRVNTVIANPVYGGDEQSVETLNEKFRQGYRLDIAYLETNRPTHMRVGQEYFRLTLATGTSHAGKDGPEIVKSLSNDRRI
jgi:hypothetical protein